MLLERAALMTRLVVFFTKANYKNKNAMTEIAPERNDDHEKKHREE